MTFHCTGEMWGMVRWGEGVTAFMWHAVDAASTGSVGRLLLYVVICRVQIIREVV